MTVQSKGRSRRVAARIKIGLTLLAIFLIAVLAFERGVSIRPQADIFGQIARQVFLSVPELIYIAGLWPLRQATKFIAEGQPFSVEVERGLRIWGSFLIIGAALGLSMPLVDRALGNDAPRAINYDVTTCIVGAIGMALLLISHLVRAAGSLESELKEMF